MGEKSRELQKQVVENHEVEGRKRVWLGAEWNWGFLKRDQLSEHGDVGKLLGFQQMEGRWRQQDKDLLGAQGAVGDSL